MTKAMMKIVKEYINEKFTEDSDPIHDMGIGINKKFIAHQLVLTNPANSYFENAESWPDNILLKYSGRLGNPEYIEGFMSNAKNIRKEDINNCLHESVMAYEFENVKLLVEKYKANPNAPKVMECALASLGIFPHRHIKDPNLEIAKFLMKHGGKIHFQNEIILREACAFADTQIIKFILDDGADPHVLNDACYRKAALWMSASPIVIKKQRQAVINLLNQYTDKKLIKEYINEKFTADSDPIKDLGIGLYVIHNFSTYDDAFNWLHAHIAIILGSDEIPGDIVYPAGHHNIYRWKYYEILKKFSDKYIRINDNPNAHLIYDVAERLRKEGYPTETVLETVKESLYEKFTADSDPIRDLKIGIISEITSEVLFHTVEYDEEQVNEIEKYDPHFAMLIKAAQQLVEEGIIEQGRYYDWMEDEELDLYIRKYRKGRYVYNANPGSDGVGVFFSEIKLPKVNKIVYENS
jgi:hypothetical protein